MSSRLTVAASEVAQSLCSFLPNSWAGRAWPPVEGSDSSVSRGRSDLGRRGAGEPRAPRPHPAKLAHTGAARYAALYGDGLARFRELSRRASERVTDPELERAVRDLLPRDFQKRLGYSTRLVNQSFVADFDVLYVQAEAARSPST